ncbi:hypothetical protein CYLTODRAFT_451905 [Cylindrobasidium torrendii FP15055 ss-10]|uniref:Uncharacterized protein n=1 Tax=Cylindrobasidium torrendii FP15055 ss-10 TaxID=1314674 RepID=A0A0D7BKV5_9AGAR|nr:hypothetical protein CYLTODRAFT_451905 [Cylindrobasidium torrendii FP15055 ss-10]
MAQPASEGRSRLETGQTLTHRKAASACIQPPPSGSAINHQRSRSTGKRPLPRVPLPRAATSSSVARPLPARPLPSRPSTSLPNTPSVSRPPSPVRDLPSSCNIDAGSTTTKPLPAPLILVSNTSSTCTPSRSDSIITVSTVRTLSPAPPTPTTARRRRMSKLRRHLGENIPDYLVPTSSPASKVPPVPSIPQDIKDKFCIPANDSVSELGIRFVRSSSPASTSEDDWQLFSGAEDSEDEQSEEEGKRDVFIEKTLTWSDERRHHFVTRPGSRYSRHWVLEKRGVRKEETDFDNILDRLRSL